MFTAAPGVVPKSLQKDSEAPEWLEGAHEAFLCITLNSRLRKYLLVHDKLGWV